MNTNKLVFKDPKLPKDVSKEMLLSILSEQIRFHRMNYLSSWEKNHSISNEETERRIQLLKRKKEEIEEIYNQIENDLIDISLSVDIKTAARKFEPELENSI